MARETPAIVGGLRARSPRAPAPRDDLESLFARQGVESNSRVRFESETFLRAADTILDARVGRAAQRCASRLKPFQCEDAKGFPRAPVGTWFTRADWRSYVGDISNHEFARRLEEGLRAAGLHERVDVATKEGYTVMVWVEEEADVAATARVIRALEVALVSEQALTQEASA